MNIEAKEICMTLGSSDILRYVSVNAHSGEFIGILGPNGCGKSTLLKCIYRVLKPTMGAVYLNDIDVSQMPYRRSAQAVSVLAQHNYYNFEFSVHDVVLMGRAPHKRAMERDNAEDYRIVEEALATVNMTPFRERAFSTLSGGEQQRVILARALAQNTPCLILDEPTNHLDIKYQLQIMDIVKGLNRTVISAVHDLNVAAMYCTRLYVMKAGEIVAEGGPVDVLTAQMIREVFEVDAEVYRDSAGILRILYAPSQKERL